MDLDNHDTLFFQRCGLSYTKAKHLQWNAIIVLYEACISGNADIIESVYHWGFSLSELNMEEFSANFEELTEYEQETFLWDLQTPPTTFKAGCMGGESLVAISNNSGFWAGFRKI